MCDHVTWSTWYCDFSDILIFVTVFYKRFRKVCPQCTCNTIVHAMEYNRSIRLRKVCPQCNTVVRDENKFLISSLNFVRLQCNLVCHHWMLSWHDNLFHCNSTNITEYTCDYMYIYAYIGVISDIARLMVARTIDPCPGEVFESTHLSFILSTNNTPKRQTCLGSPLGISARSHTIEWCSLL